MNSSYASPASLKAGQAEFPIETPRLILRKHRLDDFEASAAMWADPAIVRFIGGRVSTREEAWGRFLRHAGHWAVLGFGSWVVEEKAGGQFIGEVGFLHLKRDLIPSEGFADAPELGWALLPTTHGQGYATEAVSAAIAWGERSFGWTRMVCLIHPENIPSQRVAAKCGFNEYVRSTYKSEPTILYQRDSALTGA